MKRIAFIVQQPKRVSPGQRFRLELWEPVLREHGFEGDTFPFLNDKTRAIIYKPGNTLKKIAGVLSGFGRRIALMFHLSGYDYVMIQREITPIGPPVFEWIVTKLLRKNVIYDFDDAIWIQNSTAENKLASWFKAVWKVKYICKWSTRISGGNEYLCNYAKQYNDNVVLLPTCVDTERGHNKLKQHGDHRPVIGWTGSHSTLFYLNDITPVLKELKKEIDFEFLVIADKKPELDLEGWQFIKWNAATEQEDLLKMDVGIMPLKPDAWSEGKCGFKLIQYMALGIPAVTDPIGVNKKIVDDGLNGYVCHTKEEWKQRLKLLLTSVELRKQFGREGRKKIVDHYSVRSQTNVFLSLFS